MWADCPSWRRRSAWSRGWVGGGSARRPRRAAGGRGVDPDLVIAPCRRVSPLAVLGGHQPEVAHQLPGPLEPLEVADLGAQPDRA